ncbi:hypothetical protein FHW92_004126 [Novosphingobium sp. SG707]|nr:hypothetical protein [Novosphingobium sp. SG707]
MKIWNCPGLLKAVSGCCDVAKAIAVAAIIHWLGFGS